VHTGDILSYFSGNSDSPGLFVAEYKNFVESEINDQNNPLNEVKALVLGKENFKVFKAKENRHLSFKNNKRKQEFH